ncbi:hypothetical protein PCCS19_39860 [Paenibacillus sp. CCS19]|uniref:response regulator transcription factor n=1 Tax=Paenibacillus sp. CCS19 TaxID=3158387 RepID=UPI0025657F10|nr:response regulator [Paenibacillus cellulosilyticus]GMK40930.1 hypothetical protein PCCS19_39860 [Paenibacillus cellulosilyticus]
MHTVLIADDEPWVVYGIKSLVDWESLGFALIGEAYNGPSALKAIRECKPEVVISDIRMPGLSGIELLDCIRREGLKTNVILISGYAEFEYAQKAIRLGAFDYLLKQVDKSKLSETLTRLKTSMEENQEAQKELDLFLDDLFDLFEPEHQIKIHNFVSNRGLTGFDFPHFRFISCLYPHVTVSGKGPGEITGAGLKGLRFRTGLNKVSYLLNYDEFHNPSAFLDFISENLSGAESVGISSIGLFSTPIAKLFQESDVALFTSCFVPERRIIGYKAEDCAASLSKTILQLELAVKEQKREHIFKGLEELYGECLDRQLPIDQISTIYNQLVSIIYKYFGGSDNTGEIDYMNYDQIVRHYGSIAQLFDRIKTIFGQQHVEDLLISNETMRKIIEFIDAGYKEDLMLGDISKRFNISIGYLSTLIKKETGKTYTDYVAAKRLNLAKELLGDASLSIQEIVERVGYKDYFYFNKLFKKHFGITPSKYRKM